MDVTALLLFSGLVAATAADHRGDDANLELSLGRCALLGYEKGTEPWRNCVLEQLRNLSATSEVQRTVEGVGETSSAGADVPSRAPALESSYQPPQIKGEVSKRDRRRCARDYEGPDRVFEVDLDIGADGRAAVVGWPEGTTMDVQDAVRCIIDNTSFKPASRNSTPVVARVRLSITLGWAGSSGKLPNLLPPKLREIDSAKASKCYPPSYASSREQPVIVEVLVSKKGVLEEARVVNKDGNEFVNRTAECLALAANFEVGTVNGTPKAMRTNLTVAVKLP